jgi:hypothetical protein
MCRLPLQLLFPSIFPPSGSATAQAYGSNAKYAHGGTAKNEWTPPSTKVQDVQLSAVHAGRNDSEEYILQPNDDAFGGQKSGKGIHKVTQFSVNYHDVGEEERGSRKI